MSSGREREKASANIGVMSLLHKQNSAEYMSTSSRGCSITNFNQNTTLFVKSNTDIRQELTQLERNKSTRDVFGYACAV